MGAVPLSWGEVMVAVGRALKTTVKVRLWATAWKLAERLSVAFTVIRAVPVKVSA